MYQTVGIEKLSDNQLSRLRNGHPVRVKLGNHHKIALNISQLKKLHSASKKGSALTITFDPYQKEAHGSGLLGDIAKKAKAFIQKHKLQDMVNPIIAGAKKRAHAGVNYLSNRAKSKIDEIQEIEGEGIIGDIFSTIGNIANENSLRSCDVISSSSEDDIVSTKEYTNIYDKIYEDCHPKTGSSKT
jgi:hypothetical protein